MILTSQDNGPRFIIFRNYIFVFFIGTVSLLIIGCAPKTATEVPAPEEEQIVTVEPEEPVIETAPAEPAVVLEPEPVEEIEEAVEVVADSAAYEYLIRPDDYLTKISIDEYGDPKQWRKIYAWNIERIGDDPNYILPFHGLKLFKPVDQIVQTEYDYTIHTVVSGETLWSIAGNEYSEQRAWIVIYWDNSELLMSPNGLLKLGMELRIRTNL